MQKYHEDLPCKSCGKPHKDETKKELMNKIMPVSKESEFSTCCDLSDLVDC